MLCLTLRVNLWRGDTVHQARNVKSAFTRAIPAHRGVARSRDRSAPAWVGMVVPAMMAVTRSVPAQTVQRATVRQTCAIHVVQTHSSHAVEPAIIRVTVADSLGKPIESASVGYPATAASAMTDSHGTAVLTVSGQSPLGTTLVVRRIGYVAVRVPLRLALGDTIAATAVLCPSPTVIPMIVTTSTGTRTPSPDRGDTTPRCVSVAAAVRRDTGGRAARVPDNAIIRVHVVDSAGTTAKPIVVSAHLTSAEGGLGSGITGGYTDQHGNVTLTVPASRLGRGTSVMVVVRQISYYAAHATVQLAPGDTVEVKAALCGGAPFLSEAAGKDSAFARSDLPTAADGRTSGSPRTPPRAGSYAGAGFSLHRSLSRC